MGFGKRKATKTARNIPADIESVKADFQTKIETGLVDGKEIPRELVINFDQTGSKYVPTSEWTMNETGAKQVDIVGLDDKRQMTVLLGCTLSGSLLAPQLIYGGKTERCHPGFTFPEGWHITHNPTHWSNVDTMIQYVDAVLVPYCGNIKAKFNLPESQKALLIFDLFSAHRKDTFVEYAQSKNFIVRFIPGGCTGDLQPLDLTVNEPFKKKMKDRFTEWYASEVKQQMDGGAAAENVEVSLNISAIKPLHARWLVEVIEDISQQKDLIISGFDKAGISAAYDKVYGQARRQEGSGGERTPLFELFSV